MTLFRLENPSWYPSAGVGFDTDLRPSLCGTVYWCRLVSKVPVHRIKQLHGLLVRPQGVEDKGEQSEANEEVQAQGQGHMGVEPFPVAEEYIPHVVAEHHATVERVDHHPLVGSPKQGACPASLSGRERENDAKDWEQDFLLFILQ